MPCLGQGHIRTHETLSEGIVPEVQILQITGFVEYRRNLKKRSTG
jgi:hypothetical protein